MRGTEKSYYDDSGYLAMQREYGKTPNGNNMNGRWVLRHDGDMLDFDQYRHDLAERNNIELGRVMKFEQMIAYWELTGTTTGRSSCLTNEADGDQRHCTWTTTVANNSTYANIIYRFSIKHGVKCNYAFIYADIMFSGFLHQAQDGKVFKKNVSVTDLCKEFIGKP